MEQITNSDLNQLMKLYPKIKIPYFKEHEYYLDVLSKTIDVRSILDRYESFKKEHQDIGEYKYQKEKEILEYFKPFLDIFNEKPYPKQIEVKTKQFLGFRENHVYVSLDLNEANWHIFKKNSDMAINDKWSDYSSYRFSLHPLLANSKSYRQLIFGKLNPSRQQSFQKALMNDVALKFEDIIRVNSDELIIELKEDSDLKEKLAKIEDTYFSYRNFMKMNLYKIESLESFDETIQIKHHIPSGNRELFAVPGNRFFIHYKSLILNEPLDERDLYFEPAPKQLAKWVI